MKYLKVLLLQLLLLFVGVCFVSAEVTYYVTDKQLNELTKLINNLQNSNNDMKNLLELQNSEYETLKKNYSEKFQIMEQQSMNYQNLLNRSENKSCLYKYGISIAFAVGLVLGVILVK